MRLWYTDSVIYAIDIRRFFDNDGDGIGDLSGVTEKLDYIEQLGVDTLWLLPFFPSPFKDNGYDIQDYYGVDTKMGTPGDFVEFVRQCHDRGLHVIIDLVIHHSSDEHPWFKASEREVPRYADYYIWKGDRESEMKSAFPGESDSVWTKSSIRDQQYHHLFYAFQPDLNLGNQRVQEEIEHIMAFWLQLGVDGFRIDAVTPIIQAREYEDDHDPYHILRLLRRYASQRKGDALLIGEVDDQPDRLPEYLHSSEKLQCVKDFIVNSHLFLALAKQDASPLYRALAMLPDLPPGCRWVFFLRNLDELNLSHLPAPEREFVLDTFAPKEDARLYDRGIRRRLSPMLGSRQRLELAYSLLLSLPGIPLLIYGDEIGMGDMLTLEGRDAVRLAMQWNSERNGGFSKAKADDVKIPIQRHGDFSFTHVNVHDQDRDDDSFLNWMRTTIRTRRMASEMRTDHFGLLESPHSAVLVIVHLEEDTAMLCAHNLSDEEITVELDEADLADAETVMSDQDYGASERLVLGPYGYHWMRVPRGAVGEVV